MLRILIADDQKIFRNRFKSIFDEQPDMLVTGEACDGQEVLDMLSKETYDLLLLDITMPRKNGVEVLKELKPRFPSLPILILSMHAPEQYADKMLKAGASGYITKESAPDHLVSTIRRMFYGEHFCSQPVIVP
jgi:two-component system invasion response regulator UvrY